MFILEILGLVFSSWFSKLNLVLGFALRVGGNGFYFLKKKKKKKKEQGIAAHDYASPVFFIHPLNAQIKFQTFKCQ